MSSCGYSYQPACGCWSNGVTATNLVDIWCIDFKCLYSTYSQLVFIHTYMLYLVKFSHIRKSKELVTNWGSHRESFKLVLEYRDFLEHRLWGIILSTDYDKYAEFVFSQPYITLQIVSGSSRWLTFITYHIFLTKLLIIRHE